MKLSVRDISEIVAVCSVIVSLIFIGLEFRQNTIAMRASAYQELGLATANILFSQSLDPEILSGYGAGNEGLEEFQALPTDLAVRTRQSMRGTLRVYETIYLQVQLGLLEPEALDYLGWGTYKNNAWLKNLWPILNYDMSDEFIQHIEDSWVTD